MFFINLAMLLKHCCMSINTCVCDLIEREDEESVGLYRQISHVKHTEQLIEVNTLRTGSFKLFKRPFPGFLTILTL